MEPTAYPSGDSGFSLVEILIAMLVFLIAATGIGYSLLQSDRQVITAEHILDAEQYGMERSEAGGTGRNITVSLTGQEHNLTIPVALTLSPAQPTQACSPGLLNGIGQFLGNLLGCLFGGCSTTPASASPTSYTVSVPVTAYTMSAAQIAWWNP